MDKLLDIGVWRQFSLSIAPALLLVGSIELLYGTHRHLPKEGAGMWIAVVLFVLALVMASVLVEEFAGRFESQVDDFLYPTMRRYRRLWSAMVPKYEVDREVYMHRFNTVWERYLDLVPPKEKSIRWSY